MNSLTPILFTGIDFPQTLVDNTCSFSYDRKVRTVFLE